MSSWGPRAGSSASLPLSPPQDLGCLSLADPETLPSPRHPEFVEDPDMPPPTSQCQRGTQTHRISSLFPEKERRKSPRQPDPESELPCTFHTKSTNFGKGQRSGKGQPWLHSQGRRSNTSALQPGCQVLFRASLHLPVPTVHCGVSDDVLLVHAGVIALLTLVGLAAYVVEHVLLQEAGRVP